MTPKDATNSLSLLWLCGIAQSRMCWLYQRILWQLKYTTSIQGFIARKTVSWCHWSKKIGAKTTRKHELYTLHIDSVLFLMDSRIPQYCLQFISNLATGTEATVVIKQWPAASPTSAHIEAEYSLFFLPMCWADTMTHCRFENFLESQAYRGNLSSLTWRKCALQIASIC